MITSVTHKFPILLHLYRLLRNKDCVTCLIRKEETLRVAMEGIFTHNNWKKLPVQYQVV